MKAYRTELKPTKEQAQFMRQTFGNVRYHHNSYINANFESLDKGQGFISAMTYSKQVNNDPNTPAWLKIVSSKALKQTLFHAEAAFKDFFKGKKGRPKFKKKTKYNSAYLIGTIKVERHRIFLPTFKWVRLKEFGYIPRNVKIKSATISMENTRFYVSCLVEETKDERVPTSDQGIGIDMGLKNQFTTKNEAIISINQSKEIRELEKRLKREQRKLSRKYEANKLNVYYKSGKKKGQVRSWTWIRPLFECKNIEKQRRKVAKLYGRLARMRTEYNRKHLKMILNQKPKFITIEDLDIKGMMKNKHLSKAIAAAKWYECRQFLETQCQKLGIELRLVDRYYPSSKLCSNCGFKNTDLKLKDRHWVCPECQTHHDRDVNAAINLEQADEYTVLVSA